MTRSCEKCGGTEFRGKRQQCVPCAKVRNNARYAKLSADPAWVEARLARKRAWSHARGVTPMEERMATAIRKKAFASMLSSYHKARGKRPRADVLRDKYATDPEYRERMKLKAQLYRHSRPETGYRANDRHRRRMAEQADGTLTPEVLGRLFCSAHRCPHCQRALHHGNRELDHIVPISSGGVHGIGNVMVVCHGCNVGKGTMSLEDWVAIGRPRAPDRQRSDGVTRHNRNTEFMRSDAWKAMCSEWRSAREVA